MGKFDQEYRYKARGRLVTLRPAPDWVAVRLSDLEPNLRAASEKFLVEKAREIAPGLSLVEIRSIPVKVASAVMDSDAVTPVFQDGDTLIVPLPEVRIEVPESDAEGATAIPVSGQWLQDQPVPGQVVSERAGRMVVAPVSGYGPDAVSLAGQVASAYRSLTATPRLIRVVPRPKK